jgi:SNF2 family DNA or RNA helicase
LIDEKKKETSFMNSIGLDGSVRSEERFLAINNFNVNDDTFIFLLSTKAG